MRLTGKVYNFLIYITIAVILFLVLFGAIFGIINLFGISIDLSVTALLCVIFTVILLLIIVSAEDLESFAIIVVAFFIMLVIFNGLFGNFVSAFALSMILTLILMFYIISKL